MNGREKREVCFGRKPAFGMHDVVKEGGASPSWTGSGGLSTQWIGETESFSPFVAAEPVRQSRLPLPPPLRVIAGRREGEHLPRGSSIGGPTAEAPAARHEF